MGIPAHRSLRRILFRPSFLLEGFGIAAGVNLLLLWQGSRILSWHTGIVAALLQFAGVPWEKGRELILLPGVSAGLLRTPYLDYREHSLYPWCFVGAALALLVLGFRLCPLPLRPLLLFLPLSLGITLFYLQTIAAEVPYNSEDFCAVWYRGEMYLWLLLPWIFALGFFLLAVPLRMKMTWLSLLLFYSFLWSVIRLATALATFYYLGALWLPLFYFAFGFLADFVYIVAIYSLAMDRAAGTDRH